MLSRVGNGGPGASLSTLMFSYGTPSTFGLLSSAEARVSIDEASLLLRVCPLRLWDAAHYGRDHVYWKGRTYLLSWNKVCWSCRHGIRDH